MMDENQVDIKSETSHEIPLHEVLLSFNSDHQSEIFEYWWNKVGCKMFVEYYNRGIYV